MCWYYLLICVFVCAHLCFGFCLWFLLFWVRRTWFPFGSILPWNVIFLSSSYRLMSVSLPTIYNHITSFFQVIQEQVKCMKKYLFGKFHSNSPITSFVMSVMFGYYFLTLCMRYRIYLEYFDFCLLLWVLCVAFYLSYIWLFVRSIWFSFNCVLPWDVIFILSSFHLMSVSLHTINKHISGFFRILGSKRSVWAMPS